MTTMTTYIFTSLYTTILHIYILLEREEERGDWRKHHNEEIYNLYSSPNIFQAITQE